MSVRGNENVTFVNVGFMIALLARFIYVASLIFIFIFVGARNVQFIFSEGSTHFQFVWRLHSVDIYFGIFALAMLLTMCKNLD